MFESDLFNYLKVYHIENKIRLGNNGDGGYVISDVDNYDSYISCGVGDEFSFCKDFIQKYKTKNNFSFDGTINEVPLNYPDDLIFYKKNINTITDNDNTDLKEYLKRYKSVFLKMDIEGDEYKWIEITDTNELISIKQMVIEFHNISKNILLFITCLKKITNTHTIIHCNGNNYAGTFLKFKKNFPDVLEITFLSNHYINDKKLNLLELPSNLDFPNNPELKPIDLNFTPFKFKSYQPIIFEFYGLRRSGLHAILNWFILNITEGKKLKVINEHFYFQDNVFYINNFYEELDMDFILNFLKENKPKYLIVLYEDSCMEETILNYLNLEVLNLHKISIFRDLENLIASRLKFNLNKNNELPINTEIIKMWQKHKEYKNNIYYDFWLLNKKYRFKIAKKFSLNNFDLTDDVLYNGGGSSFIGIKLDSKKNLLNRKKIIQISSEIKDMIASVIKND
jgi:hypothetical protein